MTDTTTAARLAPTEGRAPVQRPTSPDRWTVTGHPLAIEASGERAGRPICLPVFAVMVREDQFRIIQRTCTRCGDGNG